MGHMWPYTVLYYVRIDSCDAQTNYRIETSHSRF